MFVVTKISAKEGFLLILNVILKLWNCEVAIHAKGLD
jgi:hypothetical protein